MQSQDQPLIEYLALNTFLKNLKFRLNKWIITVRLFCFGIGDMYVMKLRSFIGSRIMKTGIAVLITAFICDWIGWSPIFAVITAIVTIEPTVSDSIRKAFVRFPASAIGAAYAVLFISLFGNSPLTYTLSAIFTISTCFRLKLHDGLLVATITSVAMVEVIHSNFFMEFLTRLGTTTIGLTVSTFVNMFLLPPDYRKLIERRVESIANQLGEHIKGSYHTFLYSKCEDNDNQWLDNLLRLDKQIVKAEVLSRYQTDDAKYHFTDEHNEQFKDLKRQLHYLRIMHYHLMNVIDHPKEKLSWEDNEKDELYGVSTFISSVLNDDGTFQFANFQENKIRINQLFWQEKQKAHEENKNIFNKLPYTLVMLYELISILELSEDYYLAKHEQ